MQSKWNFEGISYDTDSWEITLNYNLIVFRFFSLSFFFLIRRKIIYHPIKIFCFSDNKNRIYKKEITPVTIVNYPDRCDTLFELNDLRVWIRKRARNLWKLNGNKGRNEIVKKETAELAYGAVAREDGPSILSIQRLCMDPRRCSTPFRK